MHRAKKKRPETQPKKHAPPREMHDYVASKCNLCFMSDKRNKENTLSVGDLAYLALPARGSLAAGHCQIIPVDHVGSMRAAASEVAEEVKNFKKCLIQMFQAQVCFCSRTNVLFCSACVIRLCRPAVHTLASLKYVEGCNTPV